MKIKYLIIVFFLLSIASIKSFGSIINGEITYKQIAEFQIEVNVIIYYSGGTTNHYQRDTLEINWGDGNISSIIRINGEDIDNNGVPDGDSISNLYSKNIYRGIHEYNNNDEFLVSTTISNRSGGILNINFPNSENVLYYIEANIQVIDDFENNHSPILLEAPIDFAIVNQPFVHIINGFDIDDDSISYKLATPLSGNNMEAPLYFFPGQIPDDPNTNFFHLNPVTGRIDWQSPQFAGVYNILIEIISYRDGQVFNRTMRDMQINVIEQENIFPSISIDTSIQPFHFVQVGDTIDFSIFSQDINSSQEISLSSSSGLYSFFIEQAQFDSTINMNEAEGNFRWIIQEEHIRGNSYHVVFKSKDDFMNIGYANFDLVKFKVLSDILDFTSNEISHPDINIFPNPTNDQLFIELKDFELPTKFQIRSIHNKLIQLGKLDNGVNQIEISSLISGSYIIFIETKIGIISSKLVIIK